MLSNISITSYINVELNSVYKMFLSLETEDLSVLQNETVVNAIRLIYKINKMHFSLSNICSRISFEDIFTAAFLESYPTSDLGAPSIGWHYDISYHIITFKYDMDFAEQNIEIYLLVPPSEQNLLTINRWVGAIGVFHVMAPMARAIAKLVMI